MQYNTQCAVQTLLTSAGPKLRAVLAPPPVYGIYNVLRMNLKTAL